MQGETYYQPTLLSTKAHLYTIWVYLFTITLVTPPAPLLAPLAPLAPSPLATLPTQIMTLSEYEVDLPPARLDLVAWPFTYAHATALTPSDALRIGGIHHQAYYDTARFYGYCAERYHGRIFYAHTHFAIANDPATRPRPVFSTGGLGVIRRARIVDTGAIVDVTALSSWQLTVLSAADCAAMIAYVQRAHPHHLPVT